MPNRNDILGRLRSFEVQPPEGLFHLVVDRLDREAAAGHDELCPGAWQPLQELENQPPAWLSAAVIQAATGNPLFAGLQAVELAPPVNAFENIWREATGAAALEPVIAEQAPSEEPAPAVHALPARGKRTFSWIKFVAAACLLVGAGWSIYRIGFNQPAPTSKPAAKAQQPVKTKTAAPQDGTVTPQPELPAHVEMARYQTYDNAHTENYFRNVSFSIDHQAVNLIENDFIVTFASYQSKELPAFLQEEEEGAVKVRLDQCSYFTISENMMKNLRRMYQRRAKGTPTRRARKELERLEKWKQADERQFDRQRQKNPLDPIDLAEFIFNY